MSKNSKNPYELMDKTSFWSKGFTQRIKENKFIEIKSLSDLIDRDAIISSAGSCFAQHVGKNLIKHGYSFKVSQIERERCGSFGLGNIYTIRQLKQWLEFTSGHRQWSDSSYYVDEDGLYYDYLIPHLPAMDSLEGIQARRGLIGDEIKDVLIKSDVFIFTLGLTEAWKNKNDEFFPMCPGTLVGAYDKDEHSFYNFDYSEILEDLYQVRDALKSLNPAVMMILTVSPVPLTATATEDHVLVATGYSKAVLRAAAGKFCNDNEAVHYFPSYELITHQLFEDWRFNDNCRTVTEAGVAYVMDHAFKTEGDELMRGENISVPDKMVISTPLWPPNKENDLCDEALLDAYSNLEEQLKKDTNLFLIGDSQFHHLSRAFDRNRIDHIGGIVMTAFGYAYKWFELHDEKIFEPGKEDLVPPVKHDASEIWDGIFKRLKKSDPKQTKIISNIGIQTFHTISKIQIASQTPDLTADMVTEYFEKDALEQIEIIRRLTQFGQVFWLEDPNFYAFLKYSDFTRNNDFEQNLKQRGFSIYPMAKNYSIYTEHLKKIAKNLNIPYISIMDEVMQDLHQMGVPLDKTRGNRPYYGSPIFYHIQLKHIIKMIHKT